MFAQPAGRRTQNHGAQAAHHRPLALLAGLVLAPASGCLMPFGPADLQMKISRAADIRLGPVVSLSLDGLTLATVGLIAGVPLWHLSSVETGVYAIKGGRAADGHVLEDLRLEGWEPIVRAREKGAESAVYVKGDEDSIAGLLVVARDEETVAIVRLRGRIHAFLEACLDESLEDGWSGFAGHVAGTVSSKAEHRSDRPDYEPPDDPDATPLENE